MPLGLRGVARGEPPTGDKSRRDRIGGGESSSTVGCQWVGLGSGLDIGVGAKVIERYGLAHSDVTGGAKGHYYTPMLMLKGFKRTIS